MKNFRPNRAMTFENLCQTNDRVPHVDVSDVSFDTYWVSFDTFLGSLLTTPKPQTTGRRSCHSCANARAGNATSTPCAPQASSLPFCLYTAYVSMCRCVYVSMCPCGDSLVLCAWCKQNCLLTSGMRTSGIVVHAEPKLNTTYLIYHVDSRMALVVMLVN